MTSNKIFDIEESELWIPNGENRIYGRLYNPVSEGKVPAIILGHGYNGSFSDWTNECRYYAEHGFAAYAYDFCGGSVNGKSTGKTTDMTILSEKSDVLSVYTHISSLDKIDGGHIFLMGGSQGGFATALAAEALGDQPAGMILYFPALCIPDNWREMFPEEREIPEEIEFWGMKLGKDFALTARRIRLFSEIGHFSKPVIFFHGEEDPVVPISYSEEAVKNYPSASLIRIAKEGHGFSPAAAGTVMEMVLQFMNENR